MRLIIFDFDGVVADSELVSNRVLAEGLTGIGMPTTLEEALRFYMGRRWRDCEAAIEERHGRALPEGFVDRQRAAVLAQSSRDMQAVPGAPAFIERFAHVPRCIASSSTQEWIAQNLELMGLSHRFEHRFSGHDIARGKPYPDLFLLAASTLDFAPSDCIVIEDSPMGVVAGKAAGMLTIGLCAGGHIIDGHAVRLREAGADHVVDSYDDVAEIVAPLLTDRRALGRGAGQGLA